MLRVTLAGLRGYARRLLATAVAIVLGVGFVAGTLIFGDTAEAALYDQFARAAKNVDLFLAPANLAPRKDDRHPPVLELPLLDRIRAVPGVAAADGRIEEYLPLLDKHGRLVSNLDQPGVAISVGSDARLRPYDVRAGTVPQRPGEVALDADTAARTSYAVGDRITVLDTQRQRHTLRLVGIVGFGAAKQYADRSVLVLTTPDLTTLAGATGYQSIVAIAAPGTSPEVLRTRAAAVVPAGTDLATGETYRHDLANRAIKQVDPFLTALLVFAGVACVVAAFVIYNTFTILLAQRVRELALLRCVGASRRQLLGSVLVEAVVVGLTGAMAGISLGLAVAYGLFSGATAIGAPLPSHPLVLTPTPVLVGLLVGVVVTVCSAVLPALRAARVAPLVALRPPVPGRIGRVRRRVLLAVLAGLIATAGTGLTVAGLRDGDPYRATLLVVGGGMLNFLAVLVASPLFVAPLVALLGGVPARLLGRRRGLPVRLGAANARRNPGRTAATTAALMIGVGLMASASVLVATVRATAAAQIAANYPVDYIVLPAATGLGDSGVPPELAARLRARAQFAGVAAVRADRATLDGRSTDLGAIDPGGLGTLVRPELLAGSLDRLGPGSVVLFDGSAPSHGRHLGDRVTVVSSNGISRVLTVVAIAAGKSEIGNTMVSWADFVALHPTTLDSEVLIKAADGVTPAQSRAALDEVLIDYPAVSVGTVADWRARLTDTVNQLIAVVAALLAVAILIALVGIMNTLSLSVFERTRESAIGRALGLTRGQLRATLLVEAMLMAAVGALVGTLFGVVYGWATTKVMFVGIHPILTVPVPQLLGYLGLAALAGMLAAVLPARRAARASIVAAMAEA
jgi:putative ABC transport system permease protein